MRPKIAGYTLYARNRHLRDHCYLLKLTVQIRQFMLKYAYESFL